MKNGRKIINATEPNVTTIVETVEQIKQNSVGFSQGLELLINFDSSDNLSMVFVYIRELKK